MRSIHDFFAEIDEQWPSGAGKTRLSLIGCGALLLQANYERSTKDSDVFETTELSVATKALLRELAGKDTAIHRRRKMYVDIVGNGIPFLPHVPTWHLVDAVNAELRHLELAVLDVVDVVVSKLKRFHANDQADVGAMIERGLVPHDRLIERFRSALDVFLYDARSPDLPAYIANLHRVERDMLGVDATEFELPDWFDR